MRPARSKVILNEKAKTGGYFPIYADKPQYEVTIQQLVNYAHHRFRLHEEILLLESINERNIENIINHMKTYNFPLNARDKSIPNGSKLPEGEEPTLFDKFKFDEISFYALLLVSLQSEANMRNFKDCERKIFQARLVSMKPGHSTPVEAILNDIDQSIFNISNPPLNPLNYIEDDHFSFPFEIILPYINPAKPDMRNGMINIPLNSIDDNSMSITSLLVDLYGKYLDRMLPSYIQAGVKNSDIAEIALELFNLKTGAFNAQKRSDLAKVTLADLDVVSRSFPPCMWAMREFLHVHHKLFFDGRLQFGLFLKGIGLTLNESLQFWRQEMAGEIGLDKFDKQYAYNIRYNYGKEGQGKSFNPYSCAGINAKPAPTDGNCHGCPFRQMSKERMKQIITKINPKISPVDIESIAAKTPEHPQIACKMFFETLHGSNSYDETGIVHPNEYFNKSEELFMKDEVPQ